MSGLGLGLAEPWAPTMALTTSGYRVRVMALTTSGYRVMVTGAFVLGYAFSHMYSTGYMYVLDNTRYICPGYMYWITYNIYWVKRLTTCKGIIYL